MSRSMTLSLAAATAALLLAIAGCATTPADPTDDPDPSASQTPSEMPTPDGVASWVVTTSAVGPISLGDDRASVTAALDGFTIEPPESCPNPNVLMSTDPATDTAIWVTFVDDLTHSISVGGSVFAGPQDAPVRTAYGLGTGSSADDVLAVHPDAVVSAEVAAPGLTVEADDGWLTFVLDEPKGTITGVVVTDQTPPLGEYCG